MNLFSKMLFGQQDLMTLSIGFEKFSFGKKSALCYFSIRKKSQRIEGYKSFF